jgi:hypothetical protein
MTPVRITLIHDRLDFSAELTEGLRANGYEVRVFHDLTIAVPPPKDPNGLELAIVRPPHGRAGLRIAVIAAPTPYSGPMIKFMVDPMTVADVIAALGSFLAPYAATLVDRRRTPRDLPGDPQG